MTETRRKLPDNNQIENALAYAQTNSSIDLSKLSADGQKLVDDIRDIIGTMREIVTVSNPITETTAFR